MKTITTAKVGRLFVSTLFAGLFSLIGFAQTYTFTNAGATGRFGPTQVQCDAAYGPGVVTINTQGIQEWVVPVTGTYQIAVQGAAGGNSTDYARQGGHGTQMIGEFSLTAGQVIKILVGQEGTTVGCTPSGGGGSFVTDISNNPYIIAGGGGASSTDFNGIDASIGNNGLTNTEGTALGGTGGMGGGACSLGPDNPWANGAGGGGLLGNGQNSPVGGSQGGFAFINGGLGGLGQTVSGGFGGGGGSGGCTVGGGGGGGYSGGAGGEHFNNCGSSFLRSGGGGGGSFNSGANQVNTPNVGTGMGLVTITLLSCTPNYTPTAASPLISCSGSTTINLASSSAGINYYLRDDADNSIIDGPVVGGGAVALNTGTINTTTTYNVLAVDPAQSGALDFDGGNDYVVVPNNAALNFTNNLTMEAWVYPRSGANMKVLGKTPIGSGYLLGVTGNTLYPEIWDAGGTNYGFSGAGSVPSNQWTHIAVTWETGGNITGYVNGVQVYQASASALPIGTNANNLILGITPWDLTSFAFDGRIDEVRLWNTTRSETDIQNTMYSCLTGGEAGLVSYYKMEDGTGSGSATDLTSGLNGTLINMDPATDWVSGQGVCSACEIEMTPTVTVTVGCTPTACFTATPNPQECGSAVVFDASCSTLDGATSFTAYEWDFDNDGQFDDGTGVNPSFTFPSFGSYTVNVRVTDNLGGQDTETTVVVVNDTQAPTALCQNIAVNLDASGNASITAAAVNNGSNDACGIASLGLSPTAFTCANLGANSVTLTVTDVSGNIGTCIATVTVLDNTAPGLGIGTLVDPFTTTSRDYISSFPDGNYYFNVGGNTFEATVNNTTAGGGWILVLNYVHQGGTNPDLNVRTTNLPIQTGAGLGANEAATAAWGHAGNALLNSLNPSELMFFGQTSGHGRIINFRTNYAAGLAYATSGTGGFNGLENPANYTLLPGHTASLLPSASLNGFYNNEGNLALTNFPFWVSGVAHWGIRGLGNRWEVDDFPGGFGNNTIHRVWGRNTDPIPAVPAMPQLADASGECNFTPTAPTVEDNCDGILTGVPDVTFPLNTQGTTVVTWTYTDGSGNTSTQLQNIILNDVTPPTITCATPAATYNADAGICSYANVGLSLDPLATGDNCGVASVENSFNNTATLDGAVFPLGTTAVTWTILDNVGLSSTCLYNITVVDAQAPTALCQNATIALNASGLAVATVADINNGSNDNCGLAGLSVAPNTFTCANLGANTVTLTVIDNAGLTATCNATVTIVDLVAPTAICRNITAQLDASGNATIVANDVNNGSSDNCSITSLSVAPNTFDCSQAGTVVSVTLTVTDQSSNTGTCSANVTVQDNIAPTAACQNTTIALDAAGSATIVAADINNGSSDACGIASLSASITTFDCSMTGDNTITLTVTDNNGNVATCNATVTVEDNIDPVITCPAVVVVNNDPGICGAAVIYADPTATDNCGGVTTETYYIPLAQVTPFESTSGPNCNGIGTDIWGCGVDLGITWNSIGSGIVSNVDVELFQSWNGNAGITSVFNAIPDNPLTFAGPFATCNNFLNSISLNPGSYNVGGLNQLTFNVATEVSCLVFDRNPDISWIPNSYARVIVTYGGGGSLSVSQTDLTGLSSGSSFPVGTTTLEYTATDDSGNTDVCTFTVTVNDNEAPNAVCAPYTVQLDAAGNGSLTAANIDGGSTDNCAIATLSASQTAFTCANVGSNNVTLTVEDIYGNSSNCIAVVTVQDNVAPTVTCNDFTVTLDASGNGTISTNDIGGLTAADACGIATVNASQTAFNCGNVGVVPVTLTVTDNNSNSANCISTITVIDNTAPVAVCQNITVDLNAAGVYNLTGVEINGGSSDACGIASYSASPSVFTCANVGPNNVTLTVTDINGNSATCTATVTVQDVTAPIITCPTNIEVDAIVNNCGRVVNYSFGVNDACATVAQTDGTGLTSGSLFPVGVTAQTYEVTDQTGTYTCSFTVTVNDIQNPVINNCPSNITVANTPSLCSAVVFWTAPTASDNCPGVVLTATQTPGSVFPLGTTPVTYTATDASGNAVFCNFTVTVNDTEAPAIASCTPNVVVSNDLAACGAIVSFAAPVYTENCTMGTEVASQLSGTFFPVGVTPVTWTLTDNAGNSSNCTFSVTVNDTEAPIASCSNGTIQLDATGNASIVAGDINNGSTDNCGIASLTASQTAFDCSNVGSNTVTLTVLDIHGNSSTCTSTITVEDNVAPVAICQDLTVQLDATGNATITAAQIDNGSNDACGIASLVASQTAFDCSHVGLNVITLTVTDNNGNTSNCTSDVTVEDNVAPVAICQNLTVQLDATGNATITAAQIDNGSNDACGISLSAAPTTFDCSNVGANTVTLTVTDDNGNVSTCTSTVTVEDNVAPTAICQNITVDLDATGSVSITANDIDNVSNDACGIASLVASQTVFNCSTVGANTVTLTVTDNNGNVSTCTAVVTVEDNLAPVLVCQDITVQLDASGAALIVSDDVLLSATDNCAIATKVLDISSFDCSNVGPNTVEVTVTDVNGNASSCTAVVTVEDNVAPTAICQNFTVQLDALGNASITANDIDNGSNDACGIASLAVAPSTFDCSNVGFNPVVLTVVDNNGNSSTCSATVTVLDQVAPVAICQDLTVQLDAAGTASITAAQIDNGSNDACGIASLVASQTAFDCSNVGSNIITFTVTDNNGNTSTCTSDVTVEDNVVPIAICQDITVQLDATGNATITAAQIDNGSNDACGIASLVASQTDFDCSNVGPNNVTLTVTDNNGNTSTCTSVVTIEDIIDPTAICQDITVQLDATGNVVIAAADVDNGSFDNCGAVVLSFTPQAPVVGFTGAFDPSNWIFSQNGGDGSFSFNGTTEVTLTGANNFVGASTTLCTTVGQAGIVSFGWNYVTTDTDGPFYDPFGYQVNGLFSALTNPSGLNNQNGSTNILLAAGDEFCFNQNSLDGAFGAGITISDMFVFTPDASTMAFDCSQVGVNPVTLFVTDLSGNVSTCTSNVTVEDNVAPIAICQNITVQLDALGDATITANDIDNGSNDACGVATLVASQTAFDCSNVGPNAITLTVTDVNGNSSTCTANVNVEDNIAPIAICQDITVELDATGNVTITAAQIDNGSNDACGIASLVASQTAFDCSNEGPNAVTLTVTDNNGNTATCASVVTVVDVLAPVITCPIDVLVSADPNDCVASSVNIGVATAIDNCSASVVITNDAPAVFPHGLTVVTWTATDGSGNSATCAQNVVVEDVFDPTIVCAGDVIVSADPGSCAATGVVLPTPTVTDNCVVVSVTNDAPTSYPLGTTMVTWTATDIDGNTAICTQFVTVEDTEIPTITCPSDVIAPANLSACSAVGVVLGTPTTTDNCTVASVTNDAPAVFALGTTTVTWTVTDAAGNTATCEQFVTVIDTELPSILCAAPVTVPADAALCSASGVVLPLPVTTDNCSVFAVTNDAPVTYPLGTTNVTWTVEDGSGNTSTCIQTVTVIDTQVPVIACPAPVTVDANFGSCEATGVALGTPVTSDNCSVATVTNNAPAIFGLGNTNVTWTVTDGSGNTASCTQVVTVVDTQVPTIICPANVTVVAAGGTCSATLVALGTPVTADNCSVATVTNDAPAVYPLGATTVTWTVIDGAGNIATCTQTVTVIDNENPIIACPAPVAVNTDLGSCDATGVVLGTPVTADNCSVATVTNNAPVAFPLGTTTVVWTVTDGSGNTATCVQPVTVTDIELPTIVCPTDVVVNAAAGLCSASGVVLGTPTFADNCSIASVTNNALATYPLGNTTVVWTVVDGSGNSATCNQIVTVVDTQLPTIACPADVTVPADLGSCVASGVALGTPVTADNCSVATVTNNAPSTYPLGNTTVTWTVVDGSGNTSTCEQIVTVIDTQLPTIICAAPMTVNTDPGVCETTMTLTVPSAADNCSVASVTSNAPATFPLGATVVTWTVLDGSGNSSTCTQLVTVEDNELPTIACPADIVVNNMPGFCGRSVNYPTPAFADNCGVASFMQTDGSGYVSGDLFPVGSTVQQFTVVDNSGNTFTCGFNVTVVDNELPVMANCPSDIVAYINEVAVCDKIVTWQEPSASDNCPGVVMTQNYFPGSSFPIGTTTVNYTVTDNAGNTVSCSFDVTVIDQASPEITVVGGTRLVLQNPTAQSYQWIDCTTGNPIPGATGTSFTPTVNGSYAVIASNGSCSDTSNCESVTTLSIEDLSFGEIVLYPNPSYNGSFAISYDGDIKAIVVYDMTGREVPVDVDLFAKTVNGSDLASGKYMVRILTEFQVITKELVVVIGE